MSGRMRMNDWDEWQTYRRDRDPPPWIKVHRRIKENQKWAKLSDAQRGQLVCMWILAADDDGMIPNDPALVRKLCMLDAEPDLQAFVSLGFMQPDASVTTRRRRVDGGMTLARARSLEAEAEREAEAETDSTTTTARERFEFGAWDEITIRSIKGLYGWGEREGTDPRAWNGVRDIDERKRLLALTAQRLSGEGKPYQARVFRNTLQTVVQEQHETTGGPF